MKAGIYEYKSNYYLLVGLCRTHDDNDEFVAYVPLRVEPGWSGTARIALRRPEDFETHFTWIGDRLP